MGEIDPLCVASLCSLQKKHSFMADKNLFSFLPLRHEKRMLASRYGEPRCTHSDHVCERCEQVWYEKCLYRDAVRETLDGTGFNLLGRPAPDHLN